MRSHSFNSINFKKEKHKNVWNSGACSSDWSSFGAGVFIIELERLLYLAYHVLHSPSIVFRASLFCHGGPSYTCSHSCHACKISRCTHYVLCHNGAHIVWSRSSLFSSSILFSSSKGPIVQQ